MITVGILKRKKFLQIKIFNALENLIVIEHNFIDSSVEMTSWFLAKVSLSYSEKIKIIQTLPCPSLLEILSLRRRCLGLWGMTDVIPLLVPSSSGTVDILPGFPNPWRFSGFLQDSWSDPECEKNLSSSVL